MRNIAMVAVIGCLVVPSLPSCIDYGQDCTPQCGAGQVCVDGVCVEDWDLYYDFEDPEQIDDWQIIRGAWSIMDGELDAYETKSAVHPGVVAVISEDVWNEDWTDYTVEVKTMLLEGKKKSGIVFRLQKADQVDRLFYLFWLDHEKQTAEGWISPGVNIGQIDTSVEINTWYTLKVEVASNKFNCYLDGELMFELEDTENTYTWGRVGLRNWDSHVRFDDVKIRY